jgi:hypothetical protein
LPLFIGLCSNGLRASLSRYWSEISGGRIDVQWVSDVPVTVPFTQAQWTTLTTTPQFGDRQRIQAAATKAGLAAGVVPIVLSNVSGEPSDAASRVRHHRRFRKDEC